MDENKAENNAPTLVKRVAVTFISVFLTILVFVFFLAAVSILIVRDITKPDKIEQMVENVDIANLRVGGVFGGEDRNVTLTEWIYDNIDSYLISVLDITEDRIAKIIEKSSLKPFIAAKLNDYILDVYSDTGNGKITEEEILYFFDKNKDIVSNEFGTMVSLDPGSLSSYLDETGILDGFALKGLIDENRLRIIRWGLSYYGITVIFLLCAILLIPIYIISNSASADVPLWLAAPFTVAGIVYLLLFALIFILINLFRSEPEAGLILSAIPFIQWDFLLAGAIILGVSLLFIAGCRVYGSRKEILSTFARINLKKARAPVRETAAETKNKNIVSGYTEVHRKSKIKSLAGRLDKRALIGGICGVLLIIAAIIFLSISVGSN